MTAEFGERDRPVDRSHRAFVGVQLAVGPTSGTRGPRGLLRHHRREVPLLNHAAKSLPQVMSPQLDDRIVRDPPDGPVGLIQRDRDFSRLGDQASELVSEFRDVPFHGDPPDLVRQGLQTTNARAP